MDEQELKDIWRRNLSELNGNVRLDSIIIMAMMEACDMAYKIGFNKGATAAANDILG